MALGGPIQVWGKEREKSVLTISRRAMKRGKERNRGGSETLVTPSRAGKGNELRPELSGRGPFCLGKDNKKMRAENDGVRRGELEFCASKR